MGSKFNYKELHLKLKLLQASMYHEMHIFCSTVISGRYEMDCHDSISFVNVISTRRSARALFNFKSSRLCTKQVNRKKRKKNRKCRQKLDLSKNKAIFQIKKQICQDDRMRRSTGKEIHQTVIKPENSLAERL